MKVLVVHPQMALYGGAEVVIIRLVNYLQDQGHEVSILTLSTEQRPEYEGLNFILPEEDKRIYYHLRGSLRALKDIYKMYRELKYLCALYANDFDVINAHNFPAIWAAPKHKKIVWMSNEVPDLWHGSQNGLLNKAFDIGRLGDRLITRSKSPTVVVSDALSAKRLHHRYGVNPTIIPYGIDGEFFARPVSVDKKDFTILQPSMVSPSKNQMATLKAADALKRIIPNLKVVFAGYKEQTPYLRQLEEYAAEHNLDATFTGQVSKETLRVLYNQAYAAVFPGRGQGSWLGPFEALAAGCPVVVSPNLTCATIVGSLGTLSDNLSEAIQDIYNYYPAYKVRALRGRKFVLENLTWDKFGAKFLEVLES